MNAANSRRVNTAKTVDEASSLNGQAMADINSADSRPGTPVSSK